MQSIIGVRILKRISLGGRITIGLALVWATSVFLFLQRGALSDFAEFFVALISDPIDKMMGGGLRRRGEIDVDKAMTTYVFMIPYFFILGYGLAGCWRLSQRLHLIKLLRRSHMSRPPKIGP